MTLFRLVDATEDDERLVQRARAADPRAFTTLYRRHVGHVARVVHAILRNEAEVDDVLQRAFADACLQLHSLREARGFRAWVTRIAVRDAHDQLRARRRRGWLDAALTALIPGARTGWRAEARAVDALYDVLDRMAPEVRVPWALHRLGGYTFAEVAEACAIGLNTAKRRVSEGQARIDRSIHE